jgi:hypothetical protein
VLGFTVHPALSACMHCRGGCWLTQSFGVGRALRLRDQRYRIEVEGSHLAIRALGDHDAVVEVGGDHTSAREDFGHTVQQHGVKYLGYLLAPTAMRDFTSACNAGVSMLISACSSGVRLAALALPDATIAPENVKATIDF